MPAEPQNGISHLTRPERQQRGRIAMAARWGQDTTEARLVFDELKATRQLREAVERLVAARRGQGLPDRVLDSATLARIAGLIAEPGATAQPDKSNDHRSKQPVPVMSGDRNGRDDHSE